MHDTIILYFFVVIDMIKISSAKICEQNKLWYMNERQRRSYGTCVHEDDWSLTLLTLVPRDDSLNKSVHDHLIVVSEAGRGRRSRVRVDVPVQPQGGTAGGLGSRTNTLDLIVASLEKDRYTIVTL